MSLFSPKRSELQKRLHRLEKELSDVDSDLRSLSRHVEKRGDALARGTATIPRRRRSRPVQTKEEPGSPEQQKVVFGEDEHVPPVVSAGYDLETPEAGPEGPEPGATAHRRDDERFASYFMSGGLKTTGPLRRERHMQRNKALFLLAFAILVAIVMWRVLIK